MLESDIVKDARRRRMEAARSDIYTVADIMAMPTTVHQMLSMDLSFAIESHIRVNKGKIKEISAMLHDGTD